MQLVIGNFFFFAAAFVFITVDVVSVGVTVVVATAAAVVVIVVCETLLTNIPSTKRQEYLTRNCCASVVVAIAALLVITLDVVVAGVATRISFLSLRCIP